MKWIGFFIFIWSGLCTAGDLPGASLYQMESKWVDQDGKAFVLKDFQGKPTLLSMVYLSCTYICPTIISEVQALEDKLSKKAKENLQIVLVSFDPVRDTPAVLKSYAVSRKLDLSRWKLITNNSESKIRELAVATNFKFRKDDKGEFTHSYMILLLDQKGVIQSRLDGANLDHKPMIDTIENLSKSK